MSNTETAPANWPTDWPQIPDTWNPTPVGDAGGVAVAAEATIRVPGEGDLVYPVTGIIMAVDEPEPSWLWIDGNRDHMIVGPPSADGDAWVVDTMPEGTTITFAAS